jgi:hypothetical protein
MSTVLSLSPRGKRRTPRALTDMRRIIDRCFPWSYGNDYIPAFLARRSEAPSMGQISRLPMPKWKREMQFLSAVEARVAVHVLYQPNFVEGLENRPCCPVPGVAVLDGHPLCAGKNLPYSSGTVEIARALGIAHPTTCDDRPCAEIELEGRCRDYFPLTSDLVVILKDGHGIRAVNLFTKKRAKNLILNTRDGELFLIQKTLYAESHIPTVKMCEDYLDVFVTNNLMRLAKMARRPKDVSDEQLAKALLYMDERLFYSAPNTWETFLRENLGLAPEAIFRIFHYGVFHRHLKVDLKEAVAMNRVHRPERINYAANFASRFLEPMP